jgi:hypothetical protein
MTKHHEIRDKHGRLIERDDDTLLRDGERLRVSLQFADSMNPVQRAVAEDAKGRRHTVKLDPEGNAVSVYEETEDSADARMVVCDAAGRSDPIALAVPGPRYLRAGKNTTDHARIQTAAAMKKEVYDAMVGHVTLRLGVIHAMEDDTTLPTAALRDFNAAYDR